jgi:hypothetical protein
MILKFIHVMASSDGRLPRTLLANAEAFADSFFSAVSTNRDALYDFYSPDATVSWQHTQSAGSAAIGALMHLLPSISFDCEQLLVSAQSVPGTESAMVVVGGQCAVGDGERHFHSVFVIEPNRTTNTALIRSQIFQLV